MRDRQRGNSRHSGKGKGKSKGKGTARSAHRVAAAFLEQQPGDLDRGARPLGQAPRAALLQALARGRGGHRTVAQGPRFGLRSVACLLTSSVGDCWLALVAYDLLGLRVGRALDEPLPARRHGSVLGVDGRCQILDRVTAQKRVDVASFGRVALLIERLEGVFVRAKGRPLMLRIWHFRCFTLLRRLRRRHGWRWWRGWRRGGSGDGLAGFDHRVDRIRLRLRLLLLLGLGGYLDRKLLLGAQFLFWRCRRCRSNRRSDRLLHP